MNYCPKTKKYNKYIKYLFSLMILDFLFTYMGVNVFNFIEEANPLLAWIFNLPFFYAFIIRLSICFIISKLLKYIYKNNIAIYKKVIFFALSLNLFVMTLHIMWFTLYCFS